MDPDLNLPVRLLMSSARLRGLLACLLLVITSSFGWAKALPAYVVIRPVINFHSASRADSDVVSQAVLGARLVEVERKDGWVRVKGDDDYPDQCLQLEDLHRELR